MMLEYVYLLNIIMLSRFVYMFSDSKLSRKGWIILVSILILGILPFTADRMFLILVIVLGVDCLILYLLERKTMQLDVLRTANFLILAFITAFLFQQNLALQFNDMILLFLNKIDQISIFSVNTTSTDYLRFSILKFGALLVTNEANLILRSIFSILGITVEKKKTEKEQHLITVKENDFRSGRVIGIIERLLMYFFILNGEIGSIGFIIAAKGFARFKELDNRLFAEYVLIGTLLSTLLSVLISGIVLSLL